MATYPKEFLFKRRNDIDTFLSEPGLNSDIYETLLEVREPNEHRYALKVSPLDIFNEAYGQALRVIVDKHPEEDFYNHYFLDAKSIFSVLMKSTWFSVSFTYSCHLVAIADKMSNVSRLFNAGMLTSQCIFLLSKS